MAWGLFFRNIAHFHCGMFSKYTNVFLAANVLADLINDLVKRPRQIVDFFPELQKGNGERSCTTSCSMIQPFLGSCKIKTALCLTFLWGSPRFYPCVRDPGACLISSFNTPTHNLHFVTRHVNRGAPAWFVESLFLVELTCEVQLKQYIPSSRSSLEPNKLRESWLSQRWIGDHATLIGKEKKRSDCDITGSFEEGDWIYQTVQKGITNPSDLQILPMRAEIWANEDLPLHTLHVLGECESGSVNEKWWKGCCDGGQKKADDLTPTWTCDNRLKAGRKENRKLSSQGLASNEELTM